MKKQLSSDVNIHVNLVLCTCNIFHEIFEQLIIARVMKIQSIYVNLELKRAGLYRYWP